MTIIKLKTLKTEMSLLDIYYEKRVFNLITKKKQSKDCMVLSCEVGPGWERCSYAGDYIVQHRFSLNAPGV